MSVIKDNFIYLFITKGKGAPSPEPAQLQQYPKQFFA
jgi:hypothetical protein